MRINAFKAIRPENELAENVASVPYDTVSRMEAAALAKNNIYSFLRIIRAEVELPSDIDVHSDLVYQHAVDNLSNFMENGTLIRDTAPALYIYRQIMDGHSQDGLVCCCNIEDYENNIIKKHEKVLTAKVEDRTRLIEELNCNTGPIFLTYRDNKEIDEIINKEKQSKPLYDFISEDGVQHTVWKIADADKIVMLFNDIPAAYIADGHHRAASAVRVGQKRRENNPAHNGSEEYNWFLSVLFPATQLKIMPYNRVVRDLNGMTAEDFLDVVKSRFIFDKEGTAEPPERGTVSMYLDGAWYTFRWGGSSDRLDADVLQDQLLAPILGIEDPKTDQRISFVGGIRGTDELEGMVDSGDFAVAFSMYPVSIGQVMAISDEGRIMPPKSTWFEPKLRSGLFVHSLED